jgi:hypothetical protein
MKITFLSRSVIPSAVCSKCLPGVIGNLLLVFQELPPRLTKVPYAQFPSEQFPQLLDCVTLATQQTMWILHDWDPARSSREVVQPATTQVHGLDETDQLHGLRDHQISTLTIYLRVHLKNIINVQKCNTRNTPWNVTEATGKTIGNMSDVFQQSRNSCSQKGSVMR